VNHSFQARERLRDDKEEATRLEAQRVESDTDDANQVLLCGFKMALLLNCVPTRCLEP
jgi:hypothetical protein